MYVVVRTYPSRVRVPSDDVIPFPPPPLPKKKTNLLPLLFMLTLSINGFVAFNVIEYDYCVTVSLKI